MADRFSDLNFLTGRRLSRSARSHLLEEVGLADHQLYIDCDTHGKHQPVDPFITERVCIHCASAGLLHTRGEEDGSHRD